MRHSRSIVSYIESAVDNDPFCACGAPMMPVDHDGALWLECARHDNPESGLLARLWSLVGHDRKLLFAAEDLAA